MKPNESQTELIITRTSTNNRRINHVPSVPIPDKHFVVELPQEVDDSNPPAYPNFSPPSYEEAFEMFKKENHLGSRRMARRLFRSNWSKQGCHLLISKEKASAKHTSKLLTLEEKHQHKIHRHS